MATAPPAIRSLGPVFALVYTGLVCAFLDLFKRKGMALIPLLLFVIFFKFQDAMASTMTGVFVRDLGFSLQEIARAYKFFGIWASIAGFLMGGVLMNWLGLIRSLWVAAFLQMVSNLGFSWLAVAGTDIYLLAAVNAFENFTAAMGNVIFVVFISKLCSDAYTATQYAGLSAIALIARSYLVAPSGYLVGWIGWFHFFIVTAVAALPGFILLYWLSSRGHLAAESDSTSPP